MTRIDRETLERMLQEPEVPEAPTDLLDRIKNEIPAELPGAAAPHAPARPWWTWRAAAALFVILGVGLLIFRTGGYERAEKSVGLPTAVRRGAEPVIESKGAEEAATVADARVEQAPAVSNEVSARRDRVLSEQHAAPPARVAVPPSKAEDSLAAGTRQTELSPPAAPRVEGDVERGVVGGVVGGVLGGILEPAPPPPRLRKQSRALADAAAPAPPPPLAMAPPPVAEAPAVQPNAEPYADVLFRHSGVNPFIDTEDDPVSTFGLDVDTASYTVARRFLLDGHLPPPAAIRPEEFLNYFDYRDAPPSRGDFAIYAEGAESIFPPGQRYATIRFGIRARDLRRTSRAPAVLTFVIDTSGSMARENRLNLVKSALNLLINELREDDEIGLVTFSNEAEVILEPTPDHDAIRAAINRLAPSGSTDVSAGLRLGYEVASEARRREANNRVILLSDGVANTGLTDGQSILRQIGQMKNRGILLNTIGVGMGNYNDVLLEQLADRGNGTYAYIDDLDEARRVFVENLTGTLQTVAEDARVQVQFNPEAVSSYRLIGYENRDIADERFRDDMTDAGEIGAGHTVTALYEVKVKPTARRGMDLATVTLRYRPSGGTQFRELTHTVKVSDVARGWDSASPSFQLATVVAAFAEMLKETYWSKAIQPDELVRRAETVAERYPGDPRVADLVTLVRRAVSLKVVAPGEE